MQNLPLPKQYGQNSSYCPPPLRVLLFEDNSAFRESLLLLFRFAADVEVVGAFPNCAELTDVVPALQPDVILMDIDLPGMNGIEATGVITEILPETQVVMLTVSEEEERIFQALRNGATGYLLKKSGPEEILEGVRMVSQGGSPMSPAIARKVLHFFRLPLDKKPGPPPVAEDPSKTPEEAEDFSSNLSPREQEILEGLVDGLSYKMIAARYFISADTVKNHIQGIYRKLHVNSKGEAISYALKKRIAGKS